MQSNAPDLDLVQYLEAVLLKARAGEVLFVVASAALLTGPGHADVLAGAFMPLAATVLAVESRQGAYVATVNGLAEAMQRLEGQDGPLNVREPSGILS